jgi:2-haloacid dehalogenase
VELPLAEVFSVPVETVLPGMAGEIMDDYCRGRMTEDRFWGRTCAKNDWSGDLAAARRVLRENMHVKIPGTEELLRELAARNRAVYLLSDHGREWIDHLLGVHDFFGVFERRFWSFELGSIKRERITFEKVLAELGSPPPREVVFVDDAAPNIEVARSTGIDAILFTGAEDLRAALTERKLI